MTKNIIYFGSPAFSAEILKSVPNIVGVVTQPDRPTGRHQTMAPSPVAMTASQFDLPVFKPEKLDDANLSHLKLLKPDYFLVVSYGKIIPDTYLAAAKTLNVHFSLLPKYRGALCIQEALKNGDTETGVTLMEMKSKLDTGPIIAQEKVKIDIDDNVATLTTKLTASAISLLGSSIPHLGSLPTHPQDSSLATYTPSHKTLTRQSAFIPWESISPLLSPLKPVLSQVEGLRGEEHQFRGDMNDRAIALHNLIRSLNPQPGAWTIINGKEVKIIKTSLTADGQQLTVDLVQISGKNPISWKQFLSGNKIA